MNFDMRANIKEIEADGTGSEFITEAKLKNLPPLSYLVDSMIPEGGLSLLYGEPAIGKSFLALDLAYSIATGRPFLGNSVKQGPVIYVAGEGVYGLPKRIRAWRVANNVDAGEEINITFRKKAIQLADINSVHDFIGSIRQLGVAPKLIIFDTLSRCFVGKDENSAKDMTTLVDIANFIQAELETAVLLLHHPSKARGSTARGSGSLEGAVDAVFVLSKNNKSLSLSCTKQKDESRFAKINLVLDIVNLEDGSKSCVIKETGSVETEDRIGGQFLETLKCLDEFGISGATSTDWCSSFHDKTTKSYETFNRYKKKLEEWDLISSDSETPKKGAIYRLTKNGDIAVTVK
jgi:KaiC/GvpD/RAD55 family RecA-like ATPase